MGGGVQKFERKKSAKIWREKVKKTAEIWREKAQKNWGNKRKKV